MIAVILLVVVVEMMVVLWVCFSSLEFAGVGLFISCIFVGVTNFPGLDFFLLELSVRLDLWIGIDLIWFLPWNILFSSTILIES